MRSKRVLGENDPKRVAKGESMYGYNEQKKTLNLTLTQTAKDILKEASSKANLSRSEFIERMLREEKFEEENSIDRKALLAVFEEIINIPGNRGGQIKMSVSKLAKLLGFEMIATGKKWKVSDKRSDL